MIHGLLRQVKDSADAVSKGCAAFFTDERPLLRAVSPLAEGTDRLFARAAVELGYELCCPLPFAQPEFEKDFAPGQALENDSLATFRRLLDVARSTGRLVVFELDGSHARAGEAYGAAGEVVLNQSDLLVVVWDGKEAAGVGGTVQTLREAMACQVPVVWVDAHAPHNCQLLLLERDLPGLGTAERCKPESGSVDLQPVVRRVLEPPRPSQKPGAAVEKPDLRQTFFAEEKPRWNFAFFWKLFRNLVGSNNLFFQSCLVQNFEEAVRTDWPTDATDPAGWVNIRLRAHYAWADKLADFYADAYRSSFVLAYFLGVIAVLLALLPTGFGWSEHHVAVGAHFCAWAELLVVTIIIVLIVCGNRWRWHERWMDYRLVAELVRQLRFLIPLGGGRPFPRVPPHLSTYGNPPETWMYWHVRAIERATGLPTARITPEYVKACLAYLDNVVRGQICFIKRAMSDINASIIAFIGGACGSSSSRSCLSVFTSFTF